MKRFLTLLLAVASLTAVSCEKEQEVKIEITSETGLVKMSVLAHSPEVNADTKTSLADNGSLYWSYGDHICVYDGYGCRDFSSDIKQDDDPTKVTTFDGKIQSGATDFKAVYPYSSSVSFSEGKFVTTIPETQYAVVGSFANKANVAVANSATSYESEDEYAMAEFIFNNVGALVKFTISQGGVHKGVTLRAFTKPATEKVYAKIAGEIQIFPATAIATATENGAEAVSVEAESGYLAAGDYYAVILPITEQKLSFTFTDGYSTKTRSTKTAVSIGRSTYYDMGTIDEGITYPDPFEGEWLLTGVKGEQVYACGKYTSGNNIQNVVAISIDAQNESIDNVAGLADCKITITKASNGYYTIQDSSDSNNYWSAAGSGTNNYLKAGAFTDDDKFYWTITQVGDYHIIKAKSSNRNTIKFNTAQGTIFSCYAEDANQGSVTLYPYSWVVESILPTADPTISCSSNTITITCATDGATIYYEIGEDAEHTNDPTNESAEYDDNNKPTISADSYVKAYAIAEGYEASSIVGQSVSYVAPGTDVIYEKYSGILTEGDYIITSGSSVALKNELASNTNYIGYVSDLAEFEENKIKNPSAAIVWHVAQDGDYWTIYNESAEKYAVSTGAKNRGNVSATNDDMAKWSVSSTEQSTSYDFVNKQNTDNSVNATLRYNSGYGFATYSTSTGSALTLYKLQEEKYDITIASGITYGTVTTSPSGSATEGATVTINATPESGYGLSTLSVTETESGDDVSVTNNQFTMPACAVTVTASFAPVPTISMNVTSIPDVAAIGATNVDVANAYSLLNGATRSKVKVTYDETIVTAASTPADGTIRYSVSENSGAAHADGWIKVQYDEEETIYEITVSQLAATYTVEVGNHTNGSVLFSPSSPVTVGTEVTLTANADTGYEFKSWDVHKKGDSSTTVTVTNNKFPMPAYAVTINATFDEASTGSTSESVVFSAQGYSNEQVMTSYTGTDFSVSFNKGTNSNAPKYYTSGTAIRAYGGNYFTVSSSKTIIGIVLTFGSSDGSNAITTNVGTYSNGSWSGSASAVTFTIGGSSGNRRLASITVTFAGSGSSTTIAAPTFSVAEGTYNAAQSVTLSCATDGATIYYTTNGDDPTNASTEYTGAIAVNVTTTIKAIAIKGEDESDVASATYTLKVATPSFSPVGGSYNAAQSVTISCATADATIRYTTDGTTPTGSSTVYSGAISVSETMEIKAIAFKANWSNSEVATATYTIGGGGEATTSTLSFNAACGGKGTADNGIKWTVSSDGTESNFDSTKGIHYGTSSGQVTYIRLSTSDISGTVTKVVVNASTASGVSATVGVTVGGNAFGGDAQNLSTSAANYTFNGSASGEIVVTVTKPSKATKAIYVKSVAVTYN